MPRYSTTPYGLKPEQGHSFPERTADCIQRRRLPRDRFGSLNETASGTRRCFIGTMDEGRAVSARFTYRPSPRRDGRDHRDANPIAWAS